MWSQKFCAYYIEIVWAETQVWEEGNTMEIPKSLKKPFPLSTWDTTVASETERSGQF